MAKVENIVHLDPSLSLNNYYFTILVLVISIFSLCPIPFYWDGLLSTKFQIWSHLPINFQYTFNFFLHEAVFLQN